MLRALRFIAGAAVAIAMWWYGTPAYNEFLSSVVSVSGVSAQADGRMIRVSRSDGPKATIPADQLTYNIILFTGLIAAVPPKRLWRGLVAVLVVLGFHIVAVFTTIQATYATRGGEWSNAHYSDLAQDFWNSADFIYRIGGMFAIAFVCWYAATLFPAAPESRPGRSRKLKKA